MWTNWCTAHFNDCTESLVLFVPDMNLSAASVRHGLPHCCDTRGTHPAKTSAAEKKQTLTRKRQCGPTHRATSVMSSLLRAETRHRQTTWSSGQNTGEEGATLPVCRAAAGHMCCFLLTPRFCSADLPQYSKINRPDVKGKPVRPLWPDELTLGQQHRAEVTYI